MWISYQFVWFLCVSGFSTYMFVFSLNQERVRSSAQSSAETQPSGFTLERPQRLDLRRSPGEEEPPSFGGPDCADLGEAALLFVYELNVYSRVLLQTTCACWTASPWTCRRWTSLQQSVCPVHCGRGIVTPPRLQTSSFPHILCVAQETTC